MNNTAWAQRFACDACGNLLGGRGLSGDPSVILTSLLDSPKFTVPRCVANAYDET